MLTPSPAHVNKTRRANAERGNSREISSVQPLVSASRRPSQQRDSNLPNSAGMHPYATAPSPNNYRTPAGVGYGRHSPNTNVHNNPNGNALHPNASESYSYGQNQASKVGTTSRENMVGNAPPRDTMAVVRGMGMYDGDHGQRVERDDDGHGRRRGFWSILCCRA
jgi:casein kinase 1